MIRSLYNWTMALADHPRALWALALVAFAESYFFPIPPDVLLIPMIIAAPHRAWLYASVTLVSSVLGGLFGYSLGALAFEQIAHPILISLGKADAVAEYAQSFNDVGIWTILTAGVTPFPFKVITIMSGATAMPLGVFVITAFVGRGLRFFAVALLLRIYGAAIRTFIERYLGWMFLLFVLFLVGGFWGTRFL